MSKRGPDVGSSVAGGYLVRSAVVNSSIVEIRVRVKVVQLGRLPINKTIMDDKIRLAVLVWIFFDEGEMRRDCIPWEFMV